jgi:hypothetical protein
MTLLSKTPRKQAPLNIDLGVLTIRNHPRSQVFMRGAEVLQGRLSIIVSLFTDGVAVHEGLSVNQISRMHCLENSIAA